MPAYLARRNHAGHYLDLFIQVDKLKLFIIIALMGYDLLQKGNQLNGVVFIWFR